jgi:hypothetical protein
MSSEKDFEDDEFNDDLPREYREDVPGSLTNSIGMKLVPIPKITNGMRTMNCNTK